MAMVQPREDASENDDERSLRRQMVDVGASLSRVQYQLVKLGVVLDRSGEWTADGALSCAHWIAEALDVEVSTAREWLRIGRVLTDLPRIDGAFAADVLSYSKVRTLTRIATSENESELLELSRDIPAGRLRSALAIWLSAHETPEETEARHQKARGVWWNIDPDGMLFGGFRLAPATAQRLLAAVEAEIVSAKRRPRDASADAWPSISQQRADAFARLLAGGGARVVTEIVVHLRACGAAFDDGTPISWNDLERIAPESFLRVLIHDAESRPINASNRRRHPSTRQKRVVRERDRACVDCGATEFLEYDHEPNFEQSGRTVVDELRLRCWSCHRARHAADLTASSEDGTGQSTPD